MGQPKLPIKGPLLSPFQDDKHGSPDINTHKEKHLHYMDIRANSEDPSLELARERLIDISHSLPDKLINSSASEDIEIVDKIAKAEEATNNELRSKLISLSYNPSPDADVGCISTTNGYP